MYRPSRDDIVIPRFGTLRIFLETPLRRRISVLGCLLAASLAEGFGFATALPLLSIVLEGEGTQSDSTLSRVAVQMMGTVGLPVTLNVLVGLVLAATLLKSALTLFAMSHVGYAVADVAAGLRRTLIAALLDVSWGYFARQPVGRLSNAMSGEAQRAGEAWLNVATFATQLFQTLVYLVLAFLVGWKVFLGSVLVGALMIISLRRFVRRARRAGRHQTIRTKTLVTRVTDALVGIKPLKAMGRHGQFGKLFSRDIRELNKSMRQQTLNRELARALQEPIVTIFLLLGLYAAVSFSNLRGADLLLLLLLLGRTAMAIGRALHSYQAISISETAYWSIRTTINEAKAVREVFAGTRVPTLKRGCALENVSFSFGKKTVVSNVSMFIPAGRITTVTGASGAGKTTLSDLLLGLYEPAQGRALIDDVPLPEIDLHRWRRMVGYVPQEVILFHDTVLANLTLGEPELTRADALRALEAAGASEFIAQLPEGLDSIVGERGTLLSGGQRQRIAVARALIHSPALLILDEATSALDPYTEAEICSNLRALSERTGLTMLAISHQAAWVEAAHQVYNVHRHQVTALSDRVPRAVASI